MRRYRKTMLKTAAPVVLLAVLLLLQGLALSAGDRHITIEDVLAFKSVGNPTYGPEGEWVYYSVQAWDREGNRYVSQVWRTPAEGGPAQQMTRHDKGVRNARVSPDGRFLAYVSSRKDGDDDSTKGGQIWLLPLRAGEPYRLTQAENGVSDYAWAPDGQSIVFATREHFFDKDTRQRRKKEKDDAVVVDADYGWSHLWHIAVDEKASASDTASADEDESESGEDGEQTTDMAGGPGAERLTQGEFNASSPEFSPDGKRLVYVAGYQGEQPSPWHHIDDNLESDIFLLELGAQEPGQGRNLTPGPGQASSPRFSPDGRHIAFSASPDAGFAVKNDLMVLDLDSGETRNAVPGADDSIGTGYWTPDSRSLLYVQPKGLYTHLLRVSAAGGSPETVLGDSGIGGFGSAMDIAPDGKTLVYLKNDPRRTADLWQRPLGPSDTSDEVQLTEVNPHLSDYAIAESRPLRWKAEDGLDIEGVLVLPLDYQEGRRYPLILQIHGGPTGRHSDVFNNRGSQIWAARGFAVLQPNPRGSTGYGFEFTQLNQNDWGGMDFHSDDMKGVDKVIEMGIADPDKMAIMGGSYGGFTTFWAVTQTGRFKAAIGHAAISDWYSFYGQTDIPQYLKWGFGGHAWDRKEVYTRWSPFEFASEVTTPLMITHGEEDQRVPIAQAEQYYTALKKMGKEVVFVRYPREGHGIREPNHIIDLLGRQERWIDQHLGIERPEMPEDQPAPKEKVETPSGG
ncbi:MAG TPA: S9 family peptidase [Acidobacteriota bacterium]|nr:S9 family peptidase [Acidobacteriota bacterium]